MTIELRHFRYFIAVAEELHFGRAAERLHISQPPLSQQIRALEGAIGVRLFERSKHHVALTEPGRQFLLLAYAVLNDVQHAIASAQRAERGEIGVLRIGFAGFFPLTNLMPQLIHDFREAYPNVGLRFQDLGSAEQVDALLNETLDLGFIRVLPGVQVTLVKTWPLSVDRLVVALPAKHPLSAKQTLTMPMLVNEHFVMYARPRGTGLYEQVINLCLAAGFTPKVAQEALELPTVLGLVAAGVGISIATSAARQIQMPNVVYRKLKATGAGIEVLLAYRRHDISPLVANFVRLARTGKCDEAQ
jgi:DNA-binding transcriptional LysR family regulator